MPTMGRAYRKCIKCGLRADTGTKRTFFNVPPNKEIRKKWLNNLSIFHEPAAKAIRVCDMHFHENDVISRSTPTLSKTGEILIASVLFRNKRLRSGAEPTEIPNIDVTSSLNKASDGDSSLAISPKSESTCNPSTAITPVCLLQTESDRPWNKTDTDFILESNLNILRKNTETDTVNHSLCVKPISELTQSLDIKTETSSFDELPFSLDLLCQKTECDSDNAKPICESTGSEKICDEPISDPSGIFGSDLPSSYNSPAVIQPTPWTSNYYREILPIVDTIPLPNANWHWYHDEKLKRIYFTSYTVMTSAAMLREIFISESNIKIRVYGKDIPLEVSLQSTHDLTSLIADIDSMHVCSGYPFYEYFRDLEFPFAERDNNVIRHRQCNFIIPDGAICIKCSKLETSLFRLAAREKLNENTDNAKRKKKSFSAKNRKKKK